MDLKLNKSEVYPFNKVIITGSKSEANRILILQALFENLEIENLSNSDDTQVLQKALSSEDEVVDVHHAGTAMRFLTAYLAVKVNKECVLTGSSRMKERPIGVLVDALRSLGADISYKENEGFPPLLIKGKTLDINYVNLKADVSSQYISALLLIAPALKNGLKLTLEGEVTSIPYIKMTLSLLNELGVKTEFVDNIIKVEPKSDAVEVLRNKVFIVESDWSSASYFYSIVALSEIGTTIELSFYKKNSLQGDSSLAAIYKEFGVTTKFSSNSIHLTKTDSGISDKSFNLNSSPDIAQTIVVTAFAMGLSCDLYGLHTLKIKETDRLEALKNELTKLGAKISVTNKSLHLKQTKSIKSAVQIETYQDHRMAMAFAPLALKTDVIIKDSEVVSKSYPEFWNDLKLLGIQINKI
ncbi:MAG: 3-phosphoshikimate 1-carboxyvinyltransferase [Flavobacteriaceae bacterium]